MVPALRAGVGRRALGLLAAATLALGGCAIPRWPVDGPLTSDYGLRFQGLRPGWHHGVDIAVPEGTPVHAMRGGTVEFAGVLGDYGNVVVLRHGPALRTVYAHLSRIDVTRGETVRGRAVIGLAGSTGNATGPHLHFEIVRYGRSDDPVRLLGGEPGRRRGRRGDGRARARVRVRGRGTELRGGGSRGGRGGAGARTCTCTRTRRWTCTNRLPAPGRAL